MDDIYTSSQATVPPWKPRILSTVQLAGAGHGRSMVHITHKQLQVTLEPVKISANVYVWAY